MFSCSALLVLYSAFRANFWHSDLANKHKLFSLQFESFLARQLVRATAFGVVLASIALCMEAEPVFGRRENTFMPHIWQ